jgi:hypothetical protein
VRPSGELVLDLTRNPELRVVGLGGLPHRALVERAEQAVVRHRVDQRGVAVLESLARAGQQVRCVRHRLHPARDDDVVLARGDELVGEGDRIQAGQAHLVDRERRDGHRDTAFDGCLAGGDLTGAGLQHLTHDHVVDGVARDTGAGECRFDRDSSEVRSGEVSE